MAVKQFFEDNPVVDPASVAYDSFLKVGIPVVSLWQLAGFV